MGIVATVQNGVSREELERLACEHGRVDLLPYGVSPTATPLTAKLLTQALEEELHGVPFSRESSRT